METASSWIPFSPKIYSFATRFPGFRDADAFLQAVSRQGSIPFVAGTRAREKGRETDRSTSHNASSFLFFDESDEKWS